MSIKLSEFITKFNNLIDDNITGTTDTAGAVDGSTLIDTALSRYDDSFFGDPERDPEWWVYLPASAALRTVKKSLSSGIISVHRVFATRVLANSAYELHKYDRAKKVIAANQALNDAYPYFYKPLYDTSLWGQNSYGISPNEYNKFIYSVPATFTEYPDRIWLLESYTGSHTAAAESLTVLTDSAASFTINELIGRVVYNKDDVSKATVTANTATTVTGTLVGGTDHKWEVGDEYIVQKPNRKPIELREYVIPDVGGTTLEFYADINENYLIALQGKTQLTQFTNDASTTELTDVQARIVCFKAAANLHRMLSGQVNAKDSGRFDSLASRYEDEFERRKVRGGMSILTHLSLDWSWME